VPVDRSVAGWTARDSSWKRDELILALEVYMRHRRSLPSAAHPDVINLSNELESFGEIASGGVPTSRSPGDVESELERLACLDSSAPSYDPTVVDEDEKEVWARFSGDEALLVRVSASIRAAIQRYGKGLLNAEFDGAEAAEGKVLTCLHQLRERDLELLTELKAKALRDTGALRCEACEFDFFKRYGERGNGFIESHYKGDLSSVEEETEVSVSDFALVCSNCHRMIHVRRPWLTFHQLIQIVRSKPHDFAKAQEGRIDVQAND
jgi:5-methylcytosine-specific restriction protein A